MPYQILNPAIVRVAGFKPVLFDLYFQIDSKIHDLMNTLECPVCLDTADRPPIYQCPEGHLLCENCNQRLANCPQCGHALLNSRNRTAEGLAVKLQVSFLIIFMSPSCHFS